jgi:hypothetical protein
LKEKSLYICGLVPNEVANFILKGKCSRSIRIKKIIPCSVSISVADPDPGSGIRCLFNPLDPGSGMGRSQHPDPGSGMNNPDHIF